MSTPLNPAAPRPAWRPCITTDAAGAGGLTGRPRAFCKTGRTRAAGLLLCGALGLGAADPGTAAAAGADGTAFVSAWRQAVAQPGAQAIADLTAWPFRFENRLLDRPAFEAQVVPALFKPAARRCLQRTRPVAEDGRLTLFCPPYGYVLGPTPAGWRFVEFFVDAP